MEPHARSLTGTPRRVVVAFLVLGPDVDAQELAAARGGGFGGGAKRLVIGEAKILAKPHHRASRGAGSAGASAGDETGASAGSESRASVATAEGMVLVVSAVVVDHARGRGDATGMRRRVVDVSAARPGWAPGNRDARRDAGREAARAPSAPPSKARAATPCPRASSMRRGLETGDPARLRRAVGCGARRGVTSTKSRRRFGHQPSLVASVRRVDVSDERRCCRLSLLNTSPRSLFRRFPDSSLFGTAALFGAPPHPLVARSSCSRRAWS